MPDAPDLSDAHATGPTGDGTGFAIAPDLARAITHLLEGETEDALRICEAVAETGRFKLPDACILSALMRKLGRTGPAQQLWQDVENGLAQLSAADPASGAAILETAKVLSGFDAVDEVETLCRRAHQLAPDDGKTLTPLLSILAYRDKIAEAQAIALAFCERNTERVELLFYLATIFSHFDAQAAVRRLLDMAGDRCKTKTQRAKLNYLLAANGLPVADLDQHGMAVEIFDNFAESYDTKLAQLGNRGPDLVFDALQELGLARTRTRRVLDAGCGTGLCAGFLRMYAREIVGVDISVRMLEKSRSKGCYDLLARTDLSERMTFPEGRFDMVVCADVLVYFGALKTVFANFHSVLSPGGWLLVTVEDEDDPKAQTGFRLHRSGRYKHSRHYLLATLAEVGFPKPRLMKHALLRNELSHPVIGTVFAVQKPALFVA